MLRPVRHFLYKFLLKKRLSSHHPYRKAVNLEKAQNIGILFQKNNDEDGIVEAFSSKLSASGKKVELLSYIPKAKRNNNPGFRFFTQKNVNWYYTPDKEVIKDFLEKEFDVLIHANVNSSLPLEYIMALSKAKFRVGKFAEDKKYCYDMMINIIADENLENFLDQVEHYLKNINKNGQQQA